MSIRPHVYGVSLQKFVDLVGSKDKKLEDELIQKYTRKYCTFRAEIVPELLADAREDIDAITKIVNGPKITVKELIEGNVNFEFDIYPQVIYTLVYHQEDMLDTYADDWRDPFLDFFADAEEKVSDIKIKKLLRYFFISRHFFGDSEIGSEFAYAFLSLEEVDELFVFMKSNPQTFSFDTEKYESVVDWLQQISKARKDLFFVAS